MSVGAAALLRWLRAARRWTQMSCVLLSFSRRWLPFERTCRRGQAALAVGRALHAGCVEIHPVPELARDLLVFLVEPLAVVRVGAAAHVATAPEPDLAEPVGIGQRLARRSADVGVTT